MKLKGLRERIDKGFVKATIGTKLKLGLGNNKSLNLRRDSAKPAAKKTQ